MSPHAWSRPVPVYEGLSKFKCRGCGAVVLSDGAAPGTGDLDEARLPEDCESASVAVVMEAYADGDVDPWHEEDVGRWMWD